MARRSWTLLCAGWAPAPPLGGMKSGREWRAGTHQRGAAGLRPGRAVNLQCEGGGRKHRVLDGSGEAGGPRNTSEGKGGLRNLRGLPPPPAPFPISGY